MTIATPGFWEPRFRASVTTFRWGVHLKFRRGSRFRHIVLKIRRANRFGRVSGRELWLGWWISDEGIRKPFSGLCLGFRVERWRDMAMAYDAKNPIYPTKPKRSK